MRNLMYWLIPCLILFSCQNTTEDMDMEVVIEQGIALSVKQAYLMAGQLIDHDDLLPRSVSPEGTLTTSGSSWWTSGFFPGTLWYLYEITGDTLLRNYAEIYSLRVEKEKFNTGDHDVGFMLNCSFGNGYRLTGDAYYRSVLLQGAESLSTRFRPVTGLIRSWDWNREVWQFPVIIDNMMNLELLEWAAKEVDSLRYDRIAQSHADITIKNHFRPDYSCYHLVSYDTITGIPELKQTRQGFADHTAWARGEAWALYGYTMMYRETKQLHYLRQAQSIADFMLNHPRLPEDKIPYWDFDAPDIPDAYRDASAGAIMASALIELSHLTDNKEYLQVAEKQLRILTSPDYLASPGTNGYFILKHSVSNIPEETEVDAPLTYADYYYVEALVRYKKLLEQKK